MPFRPNNVTGRKIFHVQLKSRYVRRILHLICELKISGQWIQVQNGNHKPWISVDRLLTLLSKSSRAKKYSTLFRPQGGTTYENKATSRLSDNCILSHVFGWSYLGKLGFGRNRHVYARVKQRVLISVTPNVSFNIWKSATIFNWPIK